MVQAARSHPLPALPLRVKESPAQWNRDARHGGDHTRSNCRSGLREHGQRRFVTVRCTGESQGRAPAKASTSARAGEEEQHEPPPADTLTGGHWAKSLIHKR